MGLWQAILLGVLGILFLAGVVFSIILGIDIAKQIAELDKRIKKGM
jgi:hypothetical protein